MLPMSKVNTRLLFPCYLLVFLLSASCRKYKETVYHIQGRLLFSNTDPTPVTGYTLEFRQLGAGTGPLPVFASSSTATTRTDAQGNFKCDFTEGSTKLMGRPEGPNPNSVDLQIRNNSPRTFYEFRNIPLGNMGDFYLFKKIDTVVLVIDTKYEIVPTDSLDINYNTVNGTQHKIKKGFSVPAGSSDVIIDTIYDAVTNQYDFKTKKYVSTIYIIQTATGSGSQKIGFGHGIQEVDAGDEKKWILNFR